MKRSRHKYQALGAYIFAGGFTLGVERHFEVLGHLEGKGGYGTRTARLNWPELPVWVGEDQWPIKALQSRSAPLDLLYGNPPCAAWSAAGHGRRHQDWRTNPVVDCSRGHQDLLAKLRPTIWCWESVPGLMTKGRALVEDLMLRANRLGYHVTVVLHDAQWLGLAQRRPRVMVVTHRVELRLAEPRYRSLDCVEVLKKVKPGGQPHTRPSFERQLTPAMLDAIAPGTSLVRWWDSSPLAESVVRKNGKLSAARALATAACRRRARPARSRVTSTSTLWNRASSPSRSRLRSAASRPASGSRRGRRRRRRWRAASAPSSAPGSRSSSWRRSTPTSRLDSPASQLSTTRNRQQRRIKNDR